MRRIAGAIRKAAVSNRIVHLWWHPHNFGAYIDENLVFLRTLLEIFAQFHESHNMQSLSMAEAATAVRQKFCADVLQTENPLVVQHGRAC
jgi:hypothetical protein